MINRLKWAIQRALYGYDETASWNLDSYLTEIIRPNLKLIRELKQGVPYTRGEDGHYSHDAERWDAILEKMIRAFELMDEEFNTNEEQDKEIEEGLELFAKYYRALWT